MAEVTQQIVPFTDVGTAGGAGLEPDELGLGYVKLT